jgi:hypothetical protein
VRNEISYSALNGTTPSPTELMWALVNQDPKSLQITWLGTNGDGSRITGGSQHGLNLIAKLSNGIASLVVVSVKDGTLAVAQSPTVTVAGSYVVSVWY